MTNDLVEIVKGIDASLARFQGPVRLEQMSQEDDNALAEFLRQERDSESHYLRYKDWTPLVGTALKYISPKKDIAKRLQEFPKVEKQLTEVLQDSKFIDLGLNQETIDAFGNLPTTLYKMLQMEIKFYESIVAISKDIAREQVSSPYVVVKDARNRDEIYRRVFQTKEQYHWFNDIRIKSSLTIMDVSYKLIDNMQSKLARTKPKNIIDKFLVWVSQWQLNRAISIFPPKVIAESFLKDEISYNSMRAERIYDR